MATPVLSQPKRRPRARRFRVYAHAQDGHQRTQAPRNHPPVVPEGLYWPSLLVRDGEELPRRGGMLGEVFRKARQEIQNPATLKRLIVDLIEPEDWMSMHADVKGDI